MAIHMPNASVPYIPGAYNFHLPFRLNGTELLFQTHLDPLGTAGFSRSATMCNERCDKCWSCFLREMKKMKIIPVLMKVSNKP